MQFELPVLHVYERGELSLSPLLDSYQLAPNCCKPEELAKKGYTGKSVFNYFGGLFTYLMNFALVEMPAFLREWAN
jgi:hypothetical protein